MRSGEKNGMWRMPGFDQISILIVPERSMASRPRNLDTDRTFRKEKATQESYDFRKKAPYFR